MGPWTGRHGGPVGGKGGDGGKGKGKEKGKEGGIWVDRGVLGCWVCDSVPTRRVELTGMMKRKKREGSHRRMGNVGLNVDKKKRKWLPW